MNSTECRNRAENVLMHTYGRYPVVLDHGDGVYLYDTDGKQYLDFSAGIGVFALGYNNTAYNDALKAQIDKLLHTSTASVPLLVKNTRSIPEAFARPSAASRAGSL